MKASLRQTMSTLHTWTGLLPGWLLFVIFLFGTVAFFHADPLGSTPAAGQNTSAKRELTGSMPSDW